MKRAHGQSLIEITTGLVVVVPVLLVLVDLSMVLLGVQANDTICRNAARAAASGEPVSAQQRAESVVSRANDRARGPLVVGFAITQPVELNITSYPMAHPDEVTGKQVNEGGPITGTTTVTTEVDIKPFLVQLAYGGKSPLTFRAKHTFPISFTQSAK